MRFLLRRALFYLVTAWAAITINFLLPRMLPGDPVQAMIARFQGRLSTDAIASLYVLFGLDTQTSTFSQYITYWGNLFEGDLHSRLVVPGLDEPRELGRPGDVGPLADHLEVRIGPDDQRLQAGEPAIEGALGC